MKENRFLVLIFSLISSFFFLSIFKYKKKFISLFWGTERHTELKLGPNMDSRSMCHVYLNQAAGIYLFLYFFNFLSLKFQNIKCFVTLFCEAYKVKTFYTHGQRVDLIRTPNTSSQNILVPLFFFFFLAFQLAKIKNLLLQNCFNIPLMATARGMWLCSLSAIFFMFYIPPKKWLFVYNDSHMSTRGQCHCLTFVKGHSDLHFQTPVVKPLEPLKPVFM